MFVVSRNVKLEDFSVKISQEGSLALVLCTLYSVEVAIE